MSESCTDFNDYLWGFVLDRAKNSLGGSGVPISRTLRSCAGACGRRYRLRSVEMMTEKANGRWQCCI